MQSLADFAQQRQKRGKTGTNDAQFSFYSDPERGWDDRPWHATSAARLFGWNRSLPDKVGERIGHSY